MLERSEPGGWSLGKIYGRGDEGWFPSEFWAPTDGSGLLDDVDDVEQI